MPEVPSPSVPGPEAYMIKRCPSLYHQALCAAAAAGLPMNIHSPLAPPVKPARFALIVKERVSAVNPVWEKYPLVAMSME